MRTNSRTRARLRCTFSFAVFLSTPTSTRCHCLLECGKGLYHSVPQFSWGKFSHVTGKLRPIAREQKYLMDYNRGYLCADVCSEKRTVFRERSLKKNVNFEEQIMSEDKYRCIYSSQIEAIVFIILQIFFANWQYHSDIPHFNLTYLDQSRASETI